MQRKWLYTAGFALALAAVACTCGSLSNLTGTALGGQPTAISGVVAPPPSNVLLQDDFSDPASGWEVGDYQEGSVGYKDGSYFVISTTNGSTMWGVANRSFTDTSVEVDATQISAASNNNNAYGIGCRIQSNDDGYYLRVSGDGYYSISKTTGGSFTYVVDWTEFERRQPGQRHQPPEGCVSGQPAHTVREWHAGRHRHRQHVHVGRPGADSHHL